VVEHLRHLQEVNIAMHARYYILPPFQIKSFELS
jgi:hypothetical protein